MANPAFNSLIEGINSQIQALNKNSLKVYDAENPEYFITGIEYNQEDDKLIFKTDEDLEELKRMHSEDE
ncbi:hypothetical protein [Clostridium sp. JN-9]|uniref:hypothetical protein n=1 Tax=Clostridium sp. JN-9 TaxID=2507159 RepID=UPI000FFDFC4C|nr:hypothetical protein [Clostridium sp. JN-9]QAT40863.1 hypothetical protein EQM05_11635 [Clostridium sp. JN-9]